MFRELYSEKRVVVEERRLRVEDSPMGAFQEAFSAKAFANNYGRPVIGWPDDFARLGRREVGCFLEAFALMHFACGRIESSVGWGAAFSRCLPEPMAWANASTHILDGLLSLLHGCVSGGRLLQAALRAVVTHNLHRGRHKPFPGESQN